MGCSAHSVPSLSKVAMRPAGGTKSGEPWLGTSSTKLTIAVLVAVSFHDGNGSVAGVCAKAGRARSTGNAKRPAIITRRPTTRIVSLIDMCRILSSSVSDDTPEADVAGG